MFVSLALIFILGIAGGYIFEKIKLPKLIFYIFLGILLGPSVFNLLSDDLLELSSFLRKVALVIILMRSGLSIDLKKLKENGVSALLLSFLPCLFEIMGVTLFATLIMKISIFEALLLGSVLAAVSPAIVVPRMIKIHNEGYGKNKGVSELVLTSSSLDDVAVIVLFYSFLNLNKMNKFEVVKLLNIPLSIVLGIIIGVLCGFIIYKIFSKVKLSTAMKVTLLLGVSFFLLFIEDALKSYLEISSLIAIMSMGVFVFNMKIDVGEVKKGLNGLWEVFEILLFSLVGALVNLDLAFRKEAFLIILVILLGLVVRSIGSFIALLPSKLNNKERLFVILSYLPKATVQATIGGIALSEGLKAGNLILIFAIFSIIITAPIGALLIDKTYKKLLIKDM